MKILFIFLFLFVSFHSLAQVLVNDIGTIFNLKENTEKLNDYFMSKDFSPADESTEGIYINSARVNDSIAKYSNILKDEFKFNNLSNEEFQLHTYYLVFKRGVLYQTCSVMFYKGKVVEIIVSSNGSDINSYIANVKTRYSPIYKVTMSTFTKSAYEVSPSVEIISPKWLNSQNKEALKTWKASFEKKYKELTEKTNLVKSVSSTFTDTRDGAVYKTIKIGTQTWMVENLRTTKFRNGEQIPEITDNSTWQNLTTGAYCNYKNTKDTSFIYTYGRLYNWFAVADSRNIAPEGWHVPSDADWAILVNFFGGIQVAGSKMKETGTTHWIYPNADATNDNYFSALPTGGRFYYGGLFSELGNRGYYWSSTQDDSSYAWYRILDFNNSNCGRERNNKQIGFAVRLIKD